MQSIWKIPHSSGCQIVGWTQKSAFIPDSNYISSTRPHRAIIASTNTNELLPVVYCLAPWTQSGVSLVQWEAFKEDLPTRLMRLVKDSKIPPCIVVCPDLYTSFGGSQFINSNLLGSHATHIVQEMIPFVEDNFNVLKGSRHRGVFGRSSGGFGAMRLAMDFADAFSTVACHSGDMGFDWVYRRSLIDLCTGLMKYQTPEGFLKFISQQKKLSGWDTNILMLLGMAAFYSPNLKATSGFDLPIDISTAEISEVIYSKWTQHDPIEVLNSNSAKENLGKLKCIFIDCGNRDQYFLQYGSRKLNRKLKEANITHLYEEFDDNHSGTTYRFDVSLPKIIEPLV